MSTALADEIASAVDEAAKDMVIDKETLGGSTENQDAAASDESGQGSSGDEGGDSSDDQRAAASGAEENQDNKQWSKEMLNQEEEGSSDDETGDESEGQDDSLDGADESEQSEISSEALARAHAVGFSVSEAKEFKDDDSLLEVVSIVEGQLRADAERQVAAEAQKQQKYEGGKKAGQKSLVDELPSLDPEVYDKEAVELFDQFKKVIKAQDEKIKELSTKQGQVEQQASASAERETVQWFDSKIAGLGEDFAEVLGTGSSFDLSSESPQARKRNEIADRISLMMAGYQATGRTPPSIDSMFDEAARVVLGSDVEKVKERNLSKALASRKRKHIPRAAGSRGVKAKQSVEDETTEMLNRKFFGK